MIKTRNFGDLSQETQDIIERFERNSINESVVLKKVETEGNRSVIYEIKEKDIILKVLLPKGQRDSDIDALLDLDGIGYFPKLYAYKQGRFLFMDKAQGLDMIKLIEQGTCNTEYRKIRSKLLDAYSKMLDRERRDWDFKLEHIFWSKETEKLTWIDFSICDKYPKALQSKEELKELERIFNGKLLDHNIKI